MNKLWLQINILFLLILLNFIMQIPYFIHLYYTPLHPLPDLKTSLPLGFVLALFLTGYILLTRHKKVGYWLLVVFLCLEFAFYLWNFVGTLIHGYPLFFQLNNPDIILRIVYSIGYINLFASGYFLFLLLNKKNLTKINVANLN